MQIFAETKRALGVGLMRVFFIMELSVELSVKLYKASNTT